MGEVVVVSDLYRIPEVKQQPLLTLAIQSVTPDDTGKTVVDSGDQSAEDVGPTIPFEDFASVMFTLSSGCMSLILHNDFCPSVPTQKHGVLSEFAV